MRKVRHPVTTPSEAPNSEAWELDALNAEARELEERIAENVAMLLEGE